MNRRPLPRKHRNIHPDLTPLQITHLPLSRQSLTQIIISPLLHSEAPTMTSPPTEKEQEDDHQSAWNAPQEIDCICSSLTSLETEWEDAVWLKQPDCHTQSPIDR